MKDKITSIVLTISFLLIACCMIYKFIYPSNDIQVQIICTVYLAFIIFFSNTFAKL